MFFWSLRRARAHQGAFTTVLLKEEGDLSGCTRHHVQTPPSKTPPCFPVSQGWRKNNVSLEKNSQVLLLYALSPRECGHWYCFKSSLGDSEICSGLRTEGKWRGKKGEHSICGNRSQGNKAKPDNVICRWRGQLMNIMTVSNLRISFIYVISGKDS